MICWRKATTSGAIHIQLPKAMGQHQLHVHESLDALSQKLASVLCARIQEAQTRKQEAFTVSLHGGRSAKALFQAVTAQVRADGLSLENMHFFWGDERCVPPGDPESNYLIAANSLLTPLNIPSERVHRIIGEAEPGFAAKQAEAELCRICEISPTGLPLLDFVVLGMGEDGHIASLFPNTPDQDAVSEACYVPVIGPKPPPQRISLTYPVLFAAREMHIIASGESKREALKQILTAQTTPAGRCIAQRGNTSVHCDFFIK